MTYVYILQSERDGRFYIGTTKNIKKRLSEHNADYVISSKKMLPLRLVFQQEYSNTTVARKIENQLKRFKRRDFILKIIKEGKIRISGP